MVQFLDRTPAIKKKIVTRKDEVSLRAYVAYKTGSTEFREETGNNRSEIDKVFKAIRSINYTGEFLIDSVLMTATSSPEGDAGDESVPVQGTCDGTEKVPCKTYGGCGRR